MSRLPEPHARYGHTKLPCGSIVYPSGSAECPVRPGQFFAWVFDGWLERPGGEVYADGHVLMGKDDLRYFATREEAAAAIRRDKSLNRQGGGG